jgi:UDP-N-acetylglucosamine 2-epimerase (non-hydrolysing)
LPAAEKTGFADGLGLAPRDFATLTLHRPANVDDRQKLLEILDALRDGLGNMPVIFPIHPRTRQRVESFGLTDRFVSQPGDPGICLVEPLGYLEFLDLNRNARLVLTDSGGLQEETTILGVSCVTLRENTERPITIDEGTNRLAGTSRDGIMRAISDALSDDNRAARRPEKWDGRAAKRIVEVLSARG